MSQNTLPTGHIKMSFWISSATFLPDPRSVQNIIHFNCPVGRFRPLCLKQNISDKPMCAAPRGESDRMRIVPRTVSITKDRNTEHCYNFGSIQSRLWLTFAEAEMKGRRRQKIKEDKRRGGGKTPSKLSPHHQTVASSNRLSKEKPEMNEKPGTIHFQHSTCVATQVSDGCLVQIGSDHTISVWRSVVECNWIHLLKCCPYMLLIMLFYFYTSVPGVVWKQDFPCKGMFLYWGFCCIYLNKGS